MGSRRIHYVQLLTIIYLLYFTLVVQLKLQSWRLSPAPLLFRHFAAQAFCGDYYPFTEETNPQHNTEKMVRVDALDLIDVVSINGVYCLVSECVSFVLPPPMIQMD
jgi:hypothetical protein